MIEYVQGDLFKHIAGSTNSIVIPHIVNNLGIWGSGFVTPLGEAFPAAKDDYISRARIIHTSETGTVEDRKNIVYGLGDTHFVEVSDNIEVANMIAQYGIRRGNTRPLRYNSLAKCLDAVAVRAAIYQQEIHAPMFGSDRAGGNWLFIEEMIKDAWILPGIKVKIYYLPESIPQNWALPNNTNH